MPRIFQIDAFTTRLFGGNPAAVVPLEAWIADETLQAIALENNLAETAFIVRMRNDWELRWFTPAIEVALCGHATLAAAHVVENHLDADASEITFRTRRSGMLVVRKTGADRFAMDFPAIPLQASADFEAVERALRHPPRELFVGQYSPDEGDLLALFGSEAEVAALAPDFGSFDMRGIRGVVATAPGRACDFVSRYFAPAAGINEDPVTGSAHCLLAPYWAGKTGKQELLARQISARGGELGCVHSGSRVTLSGQTVEYLQGEIFI